MLSRVAAGILVCSAAAACLAPELALAAPIQWPGNGHYYEVVTDVLYWSEAQAVAEARGGYLATLTTPEENAFVASLLPDGKSFLIGAFQPAGTEEPFSGWQWVTGEEFSYTNWHPGEPNDGYGVGEDFIYVYGPNIQYREPEPGYWNDIGNDPNNYIVEWTPEPASLLMLIPGLVLFRRRP